MTLPVDYILEMQNISKAFPGVQALDKTDLRVRRGSIHGLVGENGAGKSTIIKVLAGVYTRDEGSVSIDGQAIDTITPIAVHDAGVRFIHQELHLVPHFTVAESVFMGQELQGMLGLASRRMQQRAETFLRESLNCDIKGKTLIRTLSPAEKKLVQIARALIDDQAKLVIFDEPTAPLASGETEQVFKAIRRLKERGISMIYVSHYLGEITELCDEVTVFRNGSTVAVMTDIDEHATDRIIHNMVGRDIDALYPAKTVSPGQPLFISSSLSDNKRFFDINLQANRGEVLGIAGLIGSGREELIDTLYGLSVPTQGSIALEGKTLRLNTPADAVANGIVLVPRDRRNDGLVLDMSVADNINLASLDEVAIARMEKRGAAQKRATRLSDQIDIRPRNAKAITRFLSGGNQQKVVLARWLATQSSVFILDEPTVGVDIGAKVEIYQLIQNLAANGAAVIVSSSDPQELLGLCHRVMVMYRGQVVADEQALNLNFDALLALSTAGVATAVTS